MTAAFIILGVAWVWSLGVLANYRMDESTRATFFWTAVNFLTTVTLIVLFFVWWLSA